jgi:hypothetical protein
VVEFLTDNTRGRIWYEMWRGNTRLSASLWCEMALVSGVL